MSIEAISWVIKQDIPDGVAKLVAMVLADYADRHTGEAHPKIRQLAQACSQSERSVQRKLRVLQDLDVLTIQLGHCPKSGRQRANSYILHLPGVEVPDRPEPPARGDQFDAGSADESPRGDFGAPLFSGEGCPSVTGEGDNAVTGEGDSPVTPIGNPSDSTVRTDSPHPPVAGGRRASPIFRGNPGAEPVRLAADRPVAPRPVLDAAGAARFERLWAAYPPDGLAYSDRPAAERLFAGLDADDQALAVTAAGGYRAQLARPSGGKPIRAKALQGWLRQRRFTNLRVVASSAAAPPPRVFVRDGTPEWAAWEAFDRAQGRIPRNASWSETERAMGWWFASASPPASASAA